MLQSNMQKFKHGMDMGSYETLVFPSNTNNYTSFSLHHCIYKNEQCSYELAVFYCFSYGQRSQL